MSDHENQKTVTAWINESFPGATMDRRVRHLFEEVTELAVALDTGVPLEKILSVVSHAWAKAQAQDGDKNPAGEIADVEISLIGIASHAGVSKQDALDATMAANRTRSVAERQAREAAKLQLTPFKS